MFAACAAEAQTACNLLSQHYMMLLFNVNCSRLVQPQVSACLPEDKPMWTALADKAQ